MKKDDLTRWLLLLGLISLMFFYGCSGIQKQVPVSDWTSNAEPKLGRSDFVVLDRVEGVSNTQTFFWIIQVVDGSGVQLFGIKFFEDQYAYEPIQQVFGPLGVIFFPFTMLSNLFNDKTEERAYYKAMAKVPDADSILRRSITVEQTGIPIVYHSRTVKCSGKAIKIKTDKEL